MHFVNTYDINIWEFHQKLILQSPLIGGFTNPREFPIESLNYVAKFFDLINGSVIVECGTGLQGIFSGNSILYWFDKTNASTIHCIDLNIHWLNSVKGEFGLHPRIKYHHKNCLNVVPDIPKIDLIYMDFSTGNGIRRAKAYLELYKLSNKPKMILIDDTDHISPWKHTLIVPQAMSDGYKLIYIGRQTLLLRGDVAQEYNN